MIGYVIVTIYIGIGTWVTLKLREPNDTDSEWFGTAPAVIIFWLPLAIALLGVRAWHDIRSVYRRRHR